MSGETWSDTLVKIAVILCVAACLHGITDIEKRITSFERQARQGTAVFGCDWDREGMAKKISTKGSK